MNETTVEAWDRQKHETTYSYTAFCIYRNAGVHRTLLKTAKKFYDDRPACNVRQIQQWSAKNGWVKRAAEWDAYQEVEFRREMEVARKEMAARQAAYGRAMQAKGIIRIKDMLPDDMNPDQATRMMDTGVKIERGAMGATDKVEVAHTGEITQNVAIDIESTLKEYGSIIRKIGELEDSA